MKGKTNNPNGRPLGVPNKVTANLRDRVNLLIENNFDKLQADLDSIEPKDRLNTMLKLLEYVLPKQREPIEEHSDRIRIGVDAEIPSVAEIVRQLKAMDDNDRPETYI